MGTACGNGAAMAIRIAFVLLIAFIAPLRAGEIVLKRSDLELADNGLFIASEIEGLPRDPALPSVGTSDTRQEAGQLRRLVFQGKAAGFDRILYDNRDNDHSNLKQQQFPNLTFLEYDDDLQKSGLSRGPASQIGIPAPLIGNSSTAYTTGLYRRSLPRHEMTRRGGAAMAFLQYVNNSLYVNPEHRDHDLFDLFPANWAFTVISQGSSGSDQAFLDALVMSLAALKPETRARLEDTKLLSSTLQMLLRRNLQGINSSADYLTGAAHPVAMDGDTIRLGRMISHAQALTPETVPPMVGLDIAAETFQKKAGLAGINERLFDTPSAIARVFRGLGWAHEMEVRAGPVTAANDAPLRYHWVLLQGDPERVWIEPLDEAGHRARLRIAWHESYYIPVSNAPLRLRRRTSRVDIGVFADNGTEISAPAFVSISFPTHQRRTYGEVAGAMRLLSVDYDADSRADPADPKLHWAAPWKDLFEHASDGSIRGWTRHTPTGTTAYAADGSLVTGESVSYRVERREKGLPLLHMDVSR